MTLIPSGEPKVVDSIEVQYLTDRSHSHEGGHQVAVEGRQIVVLPDGRTTARKRSHAILRVLPQRGERHPHLVETIIGSLLLAGATNVAVDGEPLIETAASAVSFKFDVTDDGVLSVTSLGGAS